VSARPIAHPGVKSRYSEHGVARPRGGRAGSSTLPNAALSDQGPGFARPCGLCPRFAAGPRRLVLPRCTNFRIHSLRLSSAKVGDLLLGDARPLRHLSVSKRGDPTAGQLVTLTPTSSVYRSLIPKLSSLSGLAAVAGQ